MTTEQRRLAGLLGELAAAGVTFTVERGQIRIKGTLAPCWLPGWIERNESDLLALLGTPEPARPAPIVLWEDRRPRHNDLGNPEARSATSQPRMLAFGL